MWTNGRFDTAYPPTLVIFPWEQLFMLFDHPEDEMGVRDIVVCGVMTNLCCETTAREAFCRGYRVKFVADGTGTAVGDPIEVPRKP